MSFPLPQVEKSRNDKLKVTRRDQVKVTHPITTAVYTQLLMTLCITILQRQETDRYFAFLDSDIFATGEFLSDFIKGLASADAVFCSPSTWGYGEETEMPSWQMWDSGVYSTLAGGTCMGTTHFAAYSNEMLDELVAESGVDLRSYYWREIPEAIQKELTQRKQIKAVFDTGKLANILLGNRGRSLELATAPTLSHLGGISVSVHRMGASLPSALVQFLGGTLGRYIYFRAKSGQFVSLRVTTQVMADRIYRMNRICARRFPVTYSYSNS